MRASNLDARAMEQCPVWTWDESRDHFIPVTADRVLPTDTDVLFVRARFTAASGMRLEGFIVNPPVPYSVEVFVGSESVAFNRNLPEFCRGALQRLFELLGTPSFIVFPLRYETDFHFPGESNVAGIFDGGEVGTQK